MLSTVALLAVKLLLIAQRAMSYKKALQMVLVAPPERKRKEPIQFQIREQKSHLIGGALQNLAVGWESYPVVSLSVTWRAF